MAIHSSRGSEWNALRLRVLQHYDHQCQLQLGGCTGEATEVDHITPKVLGGTDEWDNLTAACKACNLKKSASVLTRGNYRNPKWLTV